MSEWSIKAVLESLHTDIENRLTIARKTLVHPGTKGDASEGIWLELLQKYLPKRYAAEKAHIVDSNGSFSQQMDIVVFDRQYSPFIFNYENQLIVPAESVYGVFEAKQTINLDLINYAQEKVTSARRLYRTSLPIPHAGGTYPPKQLIQIIGGILALESDWNPPLGASLMKALNDCSLEGKLNLGCIASHGTFSLSETKNEYVIQNNVKPATAFLFELISRLQFSATAPMIDINAYGKWL